MKLDKATHKALLYREMLQKKFAIDKLSDASTAAKKLREGSEELGEQLKFTDGEVSFTAEEWVVLKDVVKDKKESTIGESEGILELRQLFGL